MNTYESIINDLSPLTLIEQVYKYIYDNNISIDSALNDPTIRSMLSSSPADKNIAKNTLSSLLLEPNIRETDIFTPQTDIMVTKHPRYFPAVKHSHDFFEIQYVLSGTIQQTISQKEMTLHTGDFCFIAPTVRHAIKAFSTDIFVLNLLIRQHVFEHAFSGLLGTDGLISYFFSRALYSDNAIPFLVNHTADDSNIVTHVLKLYTTSCQMNAYTPPLLRVQFEELFLYILRDHTDDFDNSPIYRKEQQKMMSLTAYMRDHYDIVTLNSLAEQFGYNPTYLSKLIKRYTGKSFSHLLQDIRFDKAINMLHTTDNSVEDIISRLGYADRSFFYKEFKKKYGMSPAEYRKHSAGHMRSDSMFLLHSLRTASSDNLSNNL